jgi:hypothetical protein
MFQHLRDERVGVTYSALRQLDDLLGTEPRATIINHFEAQRVADPSCDIAVIASWSKARPASKGTYRHLGPPILYSNRRLIMDPWQRNACPPSINFPNKLRKAASSVADRTSFRSAERSLLDCWRRLCGAPNSPTSRSKPTKLELVINLKTATAMGGGSRGIIDASGQGNRMTRRDLVALLGAVAAFPVLAPFLARADKTRRIGVRKEFASRRPGGTEAFSGFHARVAKIPLDRGQQSPYRRTLLGGRCRSLPPQCYGQHWTIRSDPIGSFVIGN